MTQFTREKPAVGDRALEERTIGGRGIRVARVVQRTQTGQILTSTGGRYDMTGHAINKNGSDNSDYGWRLLEDTPENVERAERLEIEHLLRNTLTWRKLPTEKLRQIKAMLVEHKDDFIH